MTPLHSLVGVRSWRAEELGRWLAALYRQHDELRQWHLDGQPVSVSRVAIGQFVFTQRRRGRREDKRAAPEFPSSPDYELRAELYEQPGGVADRELLSWEPALRRSRRLVILGAPGIGKSFTTKASVLRRAEAALAALRAQSQPYQQIEIPLWLTAATLAQYGDYHEAAAALTQAVRQEYKELGLAEIFCDWLRQRLASAAPVFIVLDALDELHSHEEAGFERALKLLDAQLTQPQTRLVLTCRTLQWAEKRALVPASFGGDNVVEIAPLKPPQQRELVGKLLGNTGGAEKMAHLLQANSALQHAARTPLVLFFACLARHEITAYDTYTSIYALVVRRLFHRAHHPEGKPFWAHSEEDTEAYLLLLRQIAWALFQAAPGRLNRFTLTHWQAAARATGYTPPQTHAFLKELRRIGLLVTAGFTAKKKEQQWSFAHRSLWEYLAAWGLSEEADWLAQARPHFWYDEPEWLETLVFLAGLVDDVRPLLDALQTELDDVFGWKYYLAARFIGAANVDDEKYVAPLCELVCGWWGERHSLIQQLCPAAQPPFLLHSLLPN